MPSLAWAGKTTAFTLTLLLTACATTTVTVPVPQTVVVPVTVLVTVEVSRPVTVEVEVEVTRLAQVIVTASPTDTPPATPTSPNTPTRTPIPTRTPRPTATAIPTRTLRPTVAPTLTRTPRPPRTPTFTPSRFPTATPTDTPDPFYFSRVGNAILNILKPDPNGPALLHIVGNLSSRDVPAERLYFSIKNFDAEDNALAILVNTTAAYSGTVPIDFLPEDHTRRLEISASGPWTIRVLPLSAAKTLAATPLTGTGDDVILLNSDTRAVRISGNALGPYFGVFAYHAGTRDLIVNTTTPYAETVTLPEGTTVLEVKAVGEWTLEIP